MKTCLLFCLLCCLLLCGLLAVGLLPAVDPLGASPRVAQLGAWVSLALLGMSFAVGDAALRQTKALPAAAASVVTTAFDLGHGSAGDFLANCELKITAPALAVGQLANGSTMTYIVEHDDAAGFGTVTTLMDRVIVQTGAGGAGAAATTATVRLPVGVKRYVRVKATNSAAADASGASLTAELLF